MKKILIALLLMVAGIQATGVCQEKKDSGSIVSYLTGSAEDVQTNTSAGLLIMGGSTDVDAAFQWMIKKSGGGDVVILRASGADGYNKYVFGLGRVNSVETLIINTREKASDSIVIQKIRKAEMLFIAGGDQWNYVRYWKDTPTEDAINYLINTKKVPVGGTSAGAAILGSAYYAASTGSLTGVQAVADPYHPYSNIQRNDFINAPFMSNTITDQHYTQRGRHGRHISWLARMMQDWKLATARGIGVDEKTAVAVDDNGIATVFGQNNAYFIWNHADGPEVCSAQTPLTWDRGQSAVKTYIIAGSPAGNGSFDLNTWNQYSGGALHFQYVTDGQLFLRQQTVSAGW